MKTLYTVFLLLALSASGLATAQPVKIKNQDRLGDTLILKDISEDPQRIKKPKNIKTEFSLGPIIYTDGYGLQFNVGKPFGEELYGSGNADKYYNTHFLQLDIAERMHPKEYRNLFRGSILGLVMLQNGSNSYVYGKVNNFYAARLLYGQRRLLGGKGEPKSPLIQYTFSGGLTMGLIKPYYIKLQDGSLIKYSDTTSTLFLSEEFISGNGGFGKGWDELSLMPGIILRGGLHFDFAKRRNRKSAVEVGASLEYYFSEIRQMAEVKERQLFANIYLTYQFGKRW